jgi:hypothetical protein
VARRGLEVGDRPRADVDHARLVALRRPVLLDALSGTVAARVGLLAHMDAALGEVDVAPLEVQDLVEPQARLGREEEQDPNAWLRIGEDLRHLVRA